MRVGESGALRQPELDRLSETLRAYGYTVVAPAAVTVSDREIGRETSQNLAEARNVLGQAENALGSLRQRETEGHWGYVVRATVANGNVTPREYRCNTPHESCPQYGEDGWHIDRSWPDPDYAEIKAALETLVATLGKFRRTGRPRKAKP